MEAARAAFVYFRHAQTEDSRSFIQSFRFQTRDAIVKNMRCAAAVLEAWSKLPDDPSASAQVKERQDELRDALIVGRELIMVRLVVMIRLVFTLFCAESPRAITNPPARVDHAAIGAVVGNGGHFLVPFGDECFV